MDRRLRDTVRAKERSVKGDQEFSSSWLFLLFGVFYGRYRAEKGDPITSTMGILLNLDYSGNKELDSGVKNPEVLWGGVGY